MSSPTVTVRGEATREGPPELATLSVTLRRSGDGAEAVRAALAEGVRTLTGLVEPFADALESSATSGLHVAPQLDRRGEVRRTRHVGSYTHTLVVADFDALSPLVTALAGLDGVQLDGPWWSLRPHNALQREARLAAVEDARARAEDYAAAVGATLTALLEISDLDGGGGGGRMFAMAARAERSEPPVLEFEPPPQTVSGQVTVRFALSSVDLGASGG